MVESLLGIKVSQSQVYRTCQAAAFVTDEAVVDAPSAELVKQLAAAGQTVYGMVDGSMLLTREGWQETKAGRVFAAQAVSADEQQPPEWEVSPSGYVAHRGH